MSPNCSPGAGAQSTDNPPRPLYQRSDKGGIRVRVRVAARFKVLRGDDLSPPNISHHAAVPCNLSTPGLQPHSKILQPTNTNHETTTPDFTLQDAVPFKRPARVDRLRGTLLPSPPMHRKRKRKEKKKEGGKNTMRDLELTRVYLQMTGLDYQNDVILQICCYITDSEMKPLEPEGIDIVIRYDKPVLDAMGEWCQRTHAAVQPPSYPPPHTQCNPPP